MNAGALIRVLVLGALLIAMLVIAGLASASAQTRTETVIYRGTQVGVFASGVADLATTHRATVVYACAEGNPVLRREDGTARYGLKVALVAGTLYLNDRLLWRRGHRWQAIGVNIAVTTSQTAAALNNHRLVETGQCGPPPPPRARAVAFTVRF